LVVLVLILSMGSVIAVGVTAPYWDERPLILSPGEQREIQFQLQNMVGGEDITLRASLITGEEIASLTDKKLEYLVPFGTKDVKVGMSIKVPKQATIGTKYTVGVLFSTVTESESGEFQIGSAFEKYFDVIVQQRAIVAEENESSNKNWIYYLIGTVIIIALGAFFLVRRKTS
jgi:hypothetical protein